MHRHYYHHLRFVMIAGSCPIPNCQTCEDYYEKEKGEIREEAVQGQTPRGEEMGEVVKEGSGEVGEGS